MKISILISFLILSFAAGLGWNGNQELASARKYHGKLVAEAATLGISPNPTNPTERAHITRRDERKDKQADAKESFATLIAYLQELSNAPLEEAGTRRFLESLDLLMSLDASQLKTMIGQARAAGDLTDEHRKNIIHTLFMQMAAQQPRTALAFLTDPSNIFEDNNMNVSVVSTALCGWAEQDPMGAFEWLRNNAGDFPELVTNQTKQSVISGTAIHDPKLALQLIDELKLDNRTQTINEIGQRTQTPEERSAALSVFREHATTLSDLAERDKLMNSAISSLADAAIRDGFQAGMQWISNADLSPKEIEELSNNLARSVKPSQAGQWIEWISDQLPAEKTENSIRLIFQNWTQKDYRAAGAWLVNTADSPSKQAAVRSYAETIAPYDPEAAVQWALTLPAGPQRQTTLIQIHQNWPKDDVVGASNFAQEYEIKP